MRQRSHADEVDAGLGDGAARDGAVFTGVGVTAGIDFALTLAAVLERRPR